MHSVNGFRQLHTVAGAVDFSEDFPLRALASAGFCALQADRCSISLPALENVSGSSDIRTSNTDFDCSGLDAYKVNGVLRGAYACSGKHTATANGTFAEPEAASGSGSHLLSGAKAGIGVGLTRAVAFLAFGGYLGFLRRKKTQTHDPPSTYEVHEKESMLLHELGNETAELATGHERPELPD